MSYCGFTIVSRVFNRAYAYGLYYAEVCFEGRGNLLREHIFLNSEIIFTEALIQ